jgi:Tfp pilus assembly protein PilO
MKELINKVIANVHFLILLWGLYSLWVMFDEHKVQEDGLSTQYEQIKDDISKSQGKLKEIEDFIKKADEYKIRVENAAKNIESVQRQLPADINDTQVVTYINGELKSLNIKDSSIVPGKEETTNYFISKNYSLKAKATYLQLLVLLEQLANADRIYNIKNLKVTSTSGGKRGRFQLLSIEGTILAYRYNPSFQVDRGFDKIENLK